MLNISYTDFSWDGEFDPSLFSKILKSSSMCYCHFFPRQELSLISSMSKFAEYSDLRAFVYKNNLRTGQTFSLPSFPNMS